ncbi:hypothetical protein ACEPAI_4430 [Sanghuangporus weigelae]
MDVPTWKRKTEVQAYNISSNCRGFVLAKRITSELHGDNEPVRDVPRYEATSAVDCDGGYQDVPDNCEMYNTKSQGRGSIHMKLGSWLRYRQAFLDELISLDGCPSDDDTLKCADCSDLISTCQHYRCTDCFVSLACCSKCILSSHGSLPFHRIQIWNGQFYDKYSLYQLGLHVQLGHSGSSCPNPLPCAKNFRIMDTNGFHYVNIDFCNCGLEPHRYSQLLQLRLFCTSAEHPKTAYTFDVLDLFQDLSLQGKTNAYDFFIALVYKSDKSRPQSFHKYKDFSIAVRLWRHLAMLKRAGRAHDPAGVVGMKPGQLAVECPACPHFGRNIPSDWKEAGADRRWLYTQYKAVDANFKLKLKNRGFRDLELAPGWAYFVEEDAYQNVVNSLTEETETNTCRSQHNAILAANLRNTRDYKASGTGAVVCKRYSNMDYIILSALQTCSPKELIISYDIACQWSKNFSAQIPRYPEHLRFDLSNTNLRVAVPKFHLPAHGPQCQTRYSLNFLPKVGRTYGEGVESEWAHINGIATSTREMAPGLRHETLNDHWGAWNWKKILGFGDYFLRKLVEAVEWHSIHQKAFESSSTTVSPTAIAKWSAMISAWNADAEADDLYVEPLNETCLNDVHKEFANKDVEEARKEAASMFAVSSRSFISIRLELEERQRVFRSSKVMQNCKTSLLVANIQNMRTNLYRQILQWRRAQDIYMPRYSALREAQEQSSLEEAEKIPLDLPSEVSNLTPKELQALEIRLRKAQADNSLATIQRLCRSIAGVAAFKRMNVNGMGNRSNTRMQALFLKFHSKIDLAKQRYRQARIALIALEPNGGWTTSLKELRDEDVRGPNREDDKELKPAKDRMSEGRYQQSWIWLVPGANLENDGSDSMDFGDSIRVEWAKSKARVERWEEEIQLLCEEMWRVLCFLLWKSKWWRDQQGLRLEASGTLARGLGAYAAKQAAVFSRLASLFFDQWEARLRNLNHIPSWVSDYSNLMANCFEASNVQGKDHESFAVEGSEILGEEDDEDDEFNTNLNTGPLPDDVDFYNEDDIFALADCDDVTTLNA